MRIVYTLLLFTFCFAAQSQTKWEYGINLNFNSSFVKPVSSDTFTNKPGFGAGLMVERKFKTLTLQFSPSYSQTRYFHDFDNYTSISNALDMSLLALQPIDKNKQTFLSYGVVTSYNFMYKEPYLSTQKMPIRNTLIQSKPFDVGLQLGFGLDLNQGARLTLNYMDFFNGKQRSGSISGQIDYLQLGVQIRFVDLLNSDRTNNKYKAEQARIELANQQVKDLAKDGEGVLVFVLNSSEFQKADVLNSRTPEQIAADKITRLNNIYNAITQHYTFGSYVVTTDSLYETRSETFMVLSPDGYEHYDPAGKKRYYARIDEMFLENNGQLKWGIFIFDDQMNLLKEPFPYFTPYRQLDREFSEVGSMIKAFNQRLVEYSVVSD